MNGQGFRLRHRWLTLGVGIVALYFALVARTFSGSGGHFPMLIAVITLGVVVCDLVAGLRRRDAKPADAAAEAVEVTTEGPSLRLELFTWAWFLGSVVVLYLLGIVIGAGLSCAAYFGIRIRIGPLPALLAGAAASASFYVVFQLLAGFRLYSGIL